MRVRYLNVSKIAINIFGRQALSILFPVICVGPWRVRNTGTPDGLTPGKTAEYCQR